MTAPIPPAPRPQLLHVDAVTQSYLQQGFHVTLDTHALRVLAKPGKKVNHILHLVLSIFTLVWFIVWIALAISAKDDRSVTIYKAADGVTVQSVMES